MSEEPRTPANGRRWSARGFFQRKSLLAISPRSSERGILAFSPKRHLFVFSLFLFLCLQPDLNQAAQVILNSDDQFRYAEELMKRHEYPLAVLELERFIHFFPDDEKVPEAKLLIGQCYLNAKAYEQARKTLEKVHKDYADSLLGGKALFLIGESYYRQGVYEEANLYFKRVRESYPQPELRDAALYRLGWSHMQSQQWQEAGDLSGAWIA